MTPGHSMDYLRKLGSVGNKIRFYARDTTTGAITDTIARTNTGFKITVSTDAQGFGPAEFSGANVEDIATAGTYVAPSANKCRFVHINDGLCEIQLANSLYSITGTKQLKVLVSSPDDNVYQEIDTQLEAPVVDISAAGLAAVIRAIGLPLGDGVVATVTTQTHLILSVQQLGDFDSLTTNCTLVIFDTDESHKCLRTVVTATGGDGLIDCTINATCPWELAGGERVLVMPPWFNNVDTKLAVPVQADVRQALGVAAQAAGGYLKVDIAKVLTAAVPASHVPGVLIVDAGYAAGEAWALGGTVDVNLVALDGSLAAMANLKKFFDGTGYAGGTIRLDVTSSGLLAAIGAGETFTDLDQEAVPDTRVFRLAPGANGLRSESMTIIKGEPGNTYAADFTADAAANQKIATVDSVTLISGDPDGVQIDVLYGRYDTEARFRMAVLLPGKYVVRVAVTYRDGPSSRGDCVFEGVE